MCSYILVSHAIKMDNLRYSTNCLKTVYRDHNTLNCYLSNQNATKELVFNFVRLKRVMVSNNVFFRTKNVRLTKCAIDYTVQWKTFQCMNYPLLSVLI